MKKFTLSKTPFEGGRVRYSLTRLVLCWLLIAIIGISHTFGQTLNYATGNVTGNRENAGYVVVVPSPGSSGVTKLSDVGEPGYGTGFYYGNDILNSSTTLSSDAAVVTASRLIGVSLGGLDLLTVAGGDAYIQFRYPSAITDGRTSYVKLGAYPTGSGLAIPVGGLLSLGNNSPVVGSIYTGAGPYSISPRNENKGTLVSSTSRLLVDKSGVWFAGIIPTSNASYNSVRLDVRIAESLLGVSALNRAQSTVYNAFNITPGSADCADRPMFAGEGEVSGIATLNASALKLVSLGTIIANPHQAIDDDSDGWQTASTLKTGVASVTALGAVSQSFYFARTATANDSVRLKLSVPIGILQAKLVDGIRIKAYNGNNTTPVNGANGQTIQSSLLGVNLANLVNITVNGINTFGKLEVAVKPGAAFDRIEVILDGGVLDLDVLANGLNIHDVALALVTPVLTGTPVIGTDRIRKVYQGQTIETVTATSIGNSVSWYRQGNSTPLATGASPLNLPAGSVSTTSLGDFAYYATATKPSCTVASPQSPLTVRVLGVSYSNPPNGTQGVVYSNPVGFTGVSGSSYTFTAVTPSQLPPGLTLATNGTVSGTPTVSGSYNFNVAIQDTTLKIPVGTHQYTLVITSNLAATPGPLPFGIVGVDYKNGTSTISIPAPTGGSTPYTYAPQDAGALPPALTLNTNGTITGTPTASGTYTFTVNITDNNSNTVSGPYTIKVYPALAATPGPLPYGVVGVAYKKGSATATIPSATGGSGAYTYAIVNAGNLPPGLTFHSDKTITGTPTTKGSFTFAVKIDDDTTMQTVTQNYTIVIGQPNLLLTTNTNVTVFNSTVTTSSATLNLYNITTDSTLGTIRVAILVSSNFEIEYDGASTSGYGGTLSNPKWVKSVDVNGTTIFTSTSGIDPSSTQKIGFTYKKKAASTATANEVINIQIVSGSGGDATTGNNKASVQLVVQK